MRRYRTELAWLRLYLNAPVEPAVARAVLVAVAAMASQPRVVFQAVGVAGVVSWFVGAERTALGTLRSLVATHMPGVRLEPVTSVPHTLDAASAVSACTVRFPDAEHLPMSEVERPHVARSVLAALASARSNERTVLQLVVGPRTRPYVPRQSDTDRRRRSREGSEHGFGGVLRLAATGADAARARSLTRGLVSALRVLAAPGVRVQVRATAPRSVQQVDSPLLWPLWVRVSDAISLLGWPTAPLPLPGIPAAHPRLLPPVAAAHGRRLGVSATHPDRDVALSVEASLRHLHLVGPTGTGKSTVLARLALQDIEQGRGVVVIDPKGDLVSDIATRVPPAHLDRVVLLDPTDEAPIGISALAGDSDLAADALLGVMHSLYADSWGPRTHDLLHASLLTLARWGHGSLPMVSSLLTVPAFRRRVVGAVTSGDRLGLGAFWAGFEAMSDAERTSAVAPLLNKLRPVTLRPALRAVFGQRQPRFKLEQIFQEGKVLLVSLAKGSLGPEAAQLLGALLVALLWQQTLQRVHVPAKARRPVMLMIDEVQDYLRLPGDLGDVLAQARGLGVGLTLAHQHLEQLPPTLRSGVLANARSRVSFALSPRDASVVAATSGGLLAAEDYQALPAFHAYAQLLSSGRAAPPVSLVTQPLPSALRSLDAVQALNRERYGRLRSDVDAELLQTLDGSPTPMKGTAHDEAAPRTSGRLGRVRRSTPDQPTTYDGGAA